MAARNVTKMATSGFLLRANAARQERVRLKGGKDRERIKDMPTVEELKQRVRDAMLPLIWLSRPYGDLEVLPKKIEGYANALGVICCNGFGGRCKEWDS